MFGAFFQGMRIAAALGMGLAVAACGASGVNDSAVRSDPVSGFVMDTKLSYRPETPQCDDPLVLSRIQRRTPIEMRNTLHRHIAIEHFEDPRQTNYIPANYAESTEIVHHPKLGQLRKTRIHGKRQIAQRFCHVRARFSDHHTRSIFYVTETPMGFAGVGHNMTYCVAGLDPWYVHGNDCSAFRHH